MVVSSSSVVQKESIAMHFVMASICRVEPVLEYGTMTQISTDGICEIISIIFDPQLWRFPL